MVRVKRCATIFVAVAGMLLSSVVAPTLPSARAEDTGATLPDGDHNGPVSAYDPGRMQRNAVGDSRCSGEIAGWEMAYAPDGEDGARRLEGEVVIGHPPHGDAVFNHHTEDYDFFVVPDDHNALASNPAADYSYLMAEGNFQTGEPKEHGRIEVENEYGALPGNDADGAGYYGLPLWAWPATGDRAIVEGYWIYDCGHADPGHRSEIHPAWMVATTRNIAQSYMARGANRQGSVAQLNGPDSPFSPVTKTDVWISSFGGEAVEDSLDELGPNGEDWWQPVNSRDYDFDIPAPVRPAGLAADAQPVIRIQEPPDSYWKPPGAVAPQFDASNLSVVDHNGRTFVRVHVPFKDVATASYMLFAKTILVGWDVPAPDTQHLRIAVKRWFVYDDLENGPGQSEYSPWFNSGDVSSFLRISNGGDSDDPFDCDSDENYMPYCNPDNGENSYVDNFSVDRYVNGHDPLVIQFRAKDSEIPLENDEGGIASQSFTADDHFGVGTTHFLRQNDMTFAGEYPDDNGGQCDDEPGGACYEVEYTISRITDPTSIAITTPAFQYAQDPNRFTGRLVTPGTPDRPRAGQPVTFTFSDGTNTQVVNATTGTDGVAAPTDRLTLPAGTYTLTVAFAGTGLLDPSSMTTSAVIQRDITATSLTAAAKIRWGHQDPISVTLTEPNAAPQDEGPLPVLSKALTVSITGDLGSRTYTTGATGSDGKATISPLMDLPPGDYSIQACFTQDAWFLASCSAPQPVKITLGFASLATGGPINFSGTGHRATGDLHSEGSVLLSGNSHVLSAAPGERFEYVTTFSDTGVGDSFNAVQVAPLGITPSYLRSTYCSGASKFKGVPVKYFTKSLTFANDAVINGIYCVQGDIKIQSRVTGTAVLLATGLITTSGGNQRLRTADPTGADVLFLAGSQDPSKAISVQSTDSLFRGALVAAGGVYISSKNTTFDTGLFGRQVLVSGQGNLLKAPA